MAVSRTAAEMGMPLLATEDKYSSLISSISFCCEGDGGLDGEGGSQRASGGQLVGEPGMLCPFDSSCPCPEYVPFW
jgi:hypothetical protein